MYASVRDVRLNLSRYLVAVRNGEEVVVRNRQVPVARIIPYEAGVKAVPFPDLGKVRALTRKYRGAGAAAMVRADRDGRG